MANTELIVVREKKSNAKAAQEIYDLILKNPHQHDVPYLADELDLPQDQVIHILHNYGPDENGGVERRADGEGGGWLPEEVAEQHRVTIEDPVEIGYRWPDGELRDEVFDINNPDHLQAMGLEKIEDA